MPRKQLPAVIKKVVVIPKQDELVDAKKLPKDKLDRITHIARRQYELEQTVAELEVSLVETNKQLLIIKTVDLPQAMKEAGVPSLTLRGKGDSSYVVSVTDYIRAYIKEENKPAAFKWLRANKLGSLIKNVISCAFGMGEDKQAKALITMLRKAKISYEQKEDIHFQTLQSFVRERLKFGKELPDSIEYTTVPTSKITENVDAQT